MYDNVLVNFQRNCSYDCFISCFKNTFHLFFLFQVVHNVGLCITLFDITEIGDSYILPGDGSSHTPGILIVAVVGIPKSKRLYYIFFVGDVVVVALLVLVLLLFMLFLLLILSILLLVLILFLLLYET